MLRLLRIAILVVMTFVVLSFVAAVWRPETGPIEKTVLVVMTFGLFLLAVPVRKIGAPRP
ncbi:MAG: hypothetical protein H0X61_12695 [Acidimicrobiia bacterium]|jgi:hypothetical protein|nr:hypothetical protein [Acidimicrobiia bacterium]MDQ3390782.1 hypothetical protein [Actinomycetota bacterium]